MWYLRNYMLSWIKRKSKRYFCQQTYIYIHNLFCTLLVERTVTDFSHYCWYSFRFSLIFRRNPSTINLNVTSYQVSISSGSPWETDAAFNIINFNFKAKTYFCEWKWPNFTCMNKVFKFVTKVMTLIQNIQSYSKYLEVRIIY